MKKTQRIHLRRSIIRNGVSFFAVGFIAATSIALFMGMRSSGLGILKSADRHYTSQIVEDMEVSAVAGITEDDLQNFLAREDITLAEGGYSTTVITKRENENLVLQALSISDKINLPVVLEGTLPTNEREAAIEEQYAEKKGVKVGDTLLIQHDGALRNDLFTVSAIVNDPRYSYYITKDTRGQNAIGTGDASFYICLDKTAFSETYYGGRYSVAHLKADFSEDLYAFSEEYKEKSDQLKEALEGLSADYVVLPRNLTGDLLAIETVVTSINGLSFSFALIFLLVAIIVCYTAVTKMIADQRSLIGAQKALGFTSKEVLRHYLAYNTLCSVLGIILGCVLGIFVVEVIILFIYSVEMLIDISTLAFDYVSAAIAIVVCLAIFLIATILACRKLVNEPAIDLLRGEVPVKGKRYFFEKTRFYKKRSLYSRTMVKNLLTDKGRAATTIAGVIGCISLLVICFAIKLSILNATEKQYNEYFLYDSRLVIDSTAGDRDAFRRLLESEKLPYTEISDKLKSFKTNDDSLANLRIVTAADQAAVEDYMIFQSLTAKEQVSLQNDGAYISQKLAKVYDLKKGDTVTVLDGKGDEKSFRIADIIEHYLSFHMLVTSNAYYETVMGEPADPCVFLIKGDASVLLDQFRDMEGFLYVSDNSEYYNNANGLDLVIFVCLALSAVMALLVLLNQYVMHINKKAKELAIMRINGFTIKETKRFIYVDNIILTSIGLILGSGFGAGLSYIVIRMLETKTDHFDFYGAILPSCLLAMVVGAVFSFLVSLLALRRIKKLDLTKASAN